MPAATKQPPKRTRTCIACGAKQGKMDLLRIVRTPDGPEFDQSGRKAGRGAYVCSPECLRRAQDRRLLDRALRTRVDGQAYESIAQQMGQALAGRTDEE